MKGDLAWRGQDAFEGADLSVQVLNRQLERNEPMFELVTIDDGGDPQAARAAIERLAANGQTVGIVYAGPEDPLPEMEQFLVSTKVPLLFTFGDLFSSQLLTPHIFQMGPAYLWEARVLARYALRDRRYSRVGALTSESLSGTSARRSLQIAFGELGTNVVASELLDDDSLARSLKRLKRKRVQAVIIEGDPAQTQTVLSELSQSRARYDNTRQARRAQPWSPQILGFDTLMAPQIDPALLPQGAVAADSYARGAHYLPVPSFMQYRRAFADWWGGEPAPVGWELRAYESVQLLGRAASGFPSNRDVDLAAVLEQVKGKRFGGLDITFGTEDRTAVEQATVGLWVVPSIPVAEADRLPESLPWVPLGRGFSTEGGRTSVLKEDWRYLFRNAPPRSARAPRFKTQRFGVTTGRSDPIH